MKLILIGTFLALAMGHPTVSEQRFYHEAVGVPTAARIKAAEEATDFSGSRIVGGSPAALGTHTYLAGLLITLTTTQTSVCGAALISNSRLVTAAHCYFDGASLAMTITAVLGSTTLFTGGVRPVSNTVVMHPAWNWNTAQNDVAVIHIAPTEYTPIINSIRIPTDALLLNDFAGAWAQASGYGVNTPGGQITASQVRHQVWVEVLGREECAGAHPAHATPSVLCTDHSTNQGPCHGDSGGPLAIVTGGQNVLIGISSFFAGEGCLEGPAGWTRVTNYAFWIEANM